ncbi:MAG: hypothetical protein WKF96_00235 [Solirubrobacteraceae bacterium]
MSDLLLERDFPFGTRCTLGGGSRCIAMATKPIDGGPAFMVLAVPATRATAPHPFDWAPSTSLTLDWPP